MKKRLFMIPSLVAAGIFPSKSTAAVVGPVLEKKDSKPTLFELFRLDHKYTLAGHRSHSSHRSPLQPSLIVGGRLLDTELQPSCTDLRAACTYVRCSCGTAFEPVTFDLDASVFGT